MNTTPTVEVSSATDAAPSVDPLLGSKLQLVHNTNWKTVELNGEDVDIPQHWGIGNLSDYFKISMGPTILSQQIIKKPEKEYIPVFSATEKRSIFGYVSKDNVAKNKYLCAGDVIIAARGSIGFPKIIDCVSTSTQTTIQMKSKGGYLGEIFKAVTDLDNSHFIIEGSGIPMLTVKSVGDITVKVPPLAEQTLIAQTLTNQEDHIASLKQQSSLQRKRLDWLTEELLSGRIRVEEDVNGQPTVLKRDEQGNVVDSLPAVKLVANTNWKTVEVNGEDVEIPVDWECKMLKDVTTVVTGNTPSTNNQNYWTESSQSGIPWVTTPDIKQQNGIIKYSNKYLTQDGSGVGRVCPKGTVLVSCIATIGEVGVLIVPASFNQQINGILPSILINSDYIRHFFFYHKTAVENMAMQSVVKIINKSTFEKFEILLPKIKEQTLIAKILTAQEEYIASLDQMIAIEEKRLTWLTDELLSGRILIEEVK